MGKRSVKFLVVFFIHITERLLKGTWSYDVIDYFWAPRQLCSCYWKKEKSLDAQGQRGRKALGTIWEGAQIGIHCLNVVQSGPSYLPPPSPNPAVNLRQNAKQGRLAFYLRLCVCAMTWLSGIWNNLARRRTDQLLHCHTVRRVEWNGNAPKVSMPWLYLECTEFPRNRWDN